MPGMCWAMYVNFLLQASYQLNKIKYDFYLHFTDEETEAQSIK